MSKIIFDSGISLDGYFAGDNRSPQNPMGGASSKLHQWMFKQKAFWKHIKMEGGQEDGADGTLIEDVFARTGSYIMRKRMFEMQIIELIPSELTTHIRYKLTKK
ncbi:hypothetical protein LZG74_25755 [Dyadobacter sp. CY327]|uniref:hypothetical protein n=1 Tax=Dyadobacter sp. CY327 TaxID=2907301 RepID=UPI001F34F52E|nr:hypothetical protein [Dyadobacter sp. CY327]MCE7073739.1 hypothetical protein [Dyadobacter sp. CY327]